jgi:hypothetical protein
MDVSAGIDAADRIEAVLLACIEVVRSMRGRRVHCAGAGVGRDVSCEHAQDAAIEERMLEGLALEDRALESGDFLGFVEIAGGLYSGSKRFGHDVDLAVGVFERDVVKSQDERLRRATPEASMGWWSR